MYKLGGSFLEKLRKVKKFLLWPGGGEQSASPWVSPLLRHVGGEMGWGGPV